MISSDHWLSTVERVNFPAGHPLNAEILVIHYTEGASGQSSIDYWKQLGNGICAHLVIDRDGTVKQVRPFNQQCAHAGFSRWNGRQWVNNFGIGIELANAGDAHIAWAEQQPGYFAITAKHRNGGPTVKWEGFPPAQVAAVTAISRLLVEHYHLKDVTGHDCIAPERKRDPGPAFPMEALREACGLKGLPVVYPPA